MKIWILIVIALSSLAVSEVSNDALPLGDATYKYATLTLEPKQIVDTKSKRLVSIDTIISECADTDVFIIGEYHDNYQCHQFQRDFIRALHQKHPQIVVGFEFFRRQDDPVLSRWSAGAISEKELLQQCAWYKKSSLNYGYTKLIMDVIREYRLQAIGLNMPRQTLRTLARRGFADLSPSEQLLFPTVNISNPEHEYYVRTFFPKFATQIPNWQAHIYAVQKCWDIIMAESMRRKLSQKQYAQHKGIIIAGSAHVAYDLGIAFHYRIIDRTARITTIVPALLREQLQEPDPHHPQSGGKAKTSKLKIVSRSLGNFVFAVDDDAKNFFPVLGIDGKMQNNRFTISRVKKDSIAARHGLSPNDIILSIDNVDVISVEQLRMLLAAKNWGDTVEFKYIKKITID